ncbi:MAG: hypothetical protein AAB011_04070, partial [Candidatus Eisenbacteria bacterium]
MNLGLGARLAIAIALLAFLGPQASRLSWRRGAQIAFVVLCGAGVYGVAWLVVREYAAGRGRRLRIAVVLALASVSFSAVDHHVLVRLYGWFHDGLLALSLVLGGAAAAAFVPWPWPAAPGRRRAIAAAACV